MAYSSLQIKLVDNTNATLTLTSSSFVEAQTFIQNLTKDGGVWDSNNTWHPVTAVISISFT